MNPLVTVHCCDRCVRAAGLTPRRPADSGRESWLCGICGHHGVGSSMECTVGYWGRLQPWRLPQVNQEAER